MDQPIPPPATARASQSQKARGNLSPRDAQLWATKLWAGSQSLTKQDYWSGLPFPSPGDLHWSGLPFPSPGDLLNPGIKPGSPALEADALTTEPPGKPDTSKQRNNKYNSENVLRWWKNTIQVFQQTGTNTNHKCVRVFRAINANSALPLNMKLW